MRQRVIIRLEADFLDVFKSETLQISQLNFKLSVETNSTLTENPLSSNVMEIHSRVNFTSQNLWSSFPDDVNLTVRVAYLMLRECILPLCLFQSGR